MTAIAQALSGALVEFVWQGLLAAFLLWAALFALRNRSASLRYFVSCGALAIMALLPIVTACVLFCAPSAATPAQRLIATAHAMRAATQTPATQSIDWPALLSRWALPLWSLGVLLCSLRLVWASRQITALRRNARPADETILALFATLQQRLNFARPVRVLISTVADCPSVAGWIKPVVLLPAATLAGLTPQQLEAVLAHELAHILRYDYIVNMLQSIVETLLFYHPAVWWASARIRHERELCCDDIAVASCGDAICYARALTRLERMRTTPAMTLGSSGGSLLYRIQRLAGESGRSPSKLPGVLALVLGLACFALNMQWARGQQSNQMTATAAAAPDEPTVQVDLGGATLNHRDDIEYPGPALEKHVEGTVVVEATIDATGAVSDARVLSGPQELRKVALASVLEWHFAQEAAGSTRQVSINFQLPADMDAAKLAAEARAVKSKLAAEQKDMAQLAGIKAEQYADQLTQAQLERHLAEAKLAASSLDSETLLKQKLDTEQAAEALQQKLEMLRGQQGTLSYANSALAQAYAGQAAALQKRLAEMRAGFASGSILAGRKLKSITVEGLTSIPGELLEKLPVHVGDYLTANSLEEIDAVVKQFDEHLSTSFISRDGEVELHIERRQ